MRFYKGILFLLLSFSLGRYTVNATHIVGGDLVYKRLDTAKYEIFLRLFIDCVNGSSSAIAADSVAYIGYFNARTFELIETDTLYRTGPKRLEELHYNCIKFTSNACVDEYNYSYIKHIDPGADGIIISYQRCCRNGTITNVLNPGTSGSSYWTIIPSTSTVLVNSSPYFKKLPPNFLCTNAPLVFDHSALDPDGDSLVYSLIIPFDGASTGSPQPKMPSKPPYKNINLKAAFTVDNLMNNAIPMRIDSITGELRIFPNASGQFVVGMMVEEYRNGVKIGESHRDYQFNVQECVFDVQSYFSNPARVCSDTVGFMNLSSDSSSYHWDFGETDLAEDTSNNFQAKWFYKKPGKYKVVLIVNKTNCADTFFNWIEVVKSDSIHAAFDLSPKTGCNELKVNIVANSTLTPFRSWDMGDGKGYYINQDPLLYTYKDTGTFIIKHFIIDSTKCNIRDDRWDTVKIYGKPDASFLWDTLDCSPLVNIHNKSLPGYSGWWRWNDSLFSSDELAFTLTMNKPGLQKLMLYKFNGPCRDSMKIEFKSRFALPGSSLLDITPTIGCAPLRVNIQEQLPPGSLFRVNMGDGKSFTQNLPSTYTYTKAGDYLFVLWYSDSTGCTNADTFKVPVRTRDLPDLRFETTTEICNGNLNLFYTDIPNQHNAWKIDDVEVTKDKLASYQFNKEGKHRISLSADIDTICFDSIWKEIDVKINTLSDLDLYNIFTPGDDDNLNSFFSIGGIDSSCFEYHMIIYNRWGEVVYETHDVYDRWDGFVSNTWAPHPAGAYFVLYKFTNKETRKEDVFSGTVTIIR